jgi:hypothetical protein
MLRVLKEMVNLLPVVPMSYEWSKEAGKREIYEYSPEDFTNRKELEPLSIIITDLKKRFGCRSFSGLALVLAHHTNKGDDQIYHLDTQAKESLNILIPLCTVRG